MMSLRLSWTMIIKIKLIFQPLTLLSERLGSHLTYQLPWMKSFIGYKPTSSYFEAAVETLWLRLGSSGMAQMLTGARAKDTFSVIVLQI